MAGDDGLPLYLRIGQSGRECHIGDLQPLADQIGVSEASIRDAIAGLLIAAGHAVRSANFAVLLDAIDGEEDSGTDSECPDLIISAEDGDG